MAGKQEKPKETQRVKTKAIAITETVTPNQLLHLAVESNANVEQLEKLMDLQLRWDANEARKSYVEAMTKFRSNCPVINKTKLVDFETRSGDRMGYKYAPLGVTIDNIKDIMSDCGLSHSWRISQVNGLISVTCVVTHTKGHSEDTTLSGLPDDSGKKNSIQQIASTVSYLERYTLFALLGLASQDMDDDGQGAGKPTSQQKMIESLIKEAWNNYAEKNDKLLSGGTEIGFEKFKEELRSQFTSLPAKEKAAFQWTTESIETLAAKININNVIEKKINDKTTKGQ